MQTQLTRIALAAVERDVLEARTREFLAWRDRGDFGRSRTHLSAVVNYDPSGGFSLTRLPAHCEGLEAAEAIFRSFHREHETLDSRIYHIVVQDEHVVVRREVRLRHRGTSASGMVFQIHFFLYRNGLIGELAEFTDTAALERLASGQDFSGERRCRL